MAFLSRDDSVYWAPLSCYVWAPPGLPVAQSWRSMPVLQSTVSTCMAQRAARCMPSMVWLCVGIHTYGWVRGIGCVRLGRAPPLRQLTPQSPLRQANGVWKSSAMPQLLPLTPTSLLCGNYVGIRGGYHSVAPAAALCYFLSPTWFCTSCWGQPAFLHKPAETRLAPS